MIGKISAAALAIVLVTAGLVGFTFSGMWAWELYEYVTADVSGAEETARLLFKNVCKREGLDESDFVGPTRIVLATDIYSFVWNAKALDGVSIRYDMSYLPYRADYYIEGELDGMRRRPKIPMKPFD